MCEVTVDSSHVEEMVDVDDAAQEGAAQESHGSAQPGLARHC